MLKVFPWLRWAKALSPLSGSLLVVTDFYLHLFQAMDPESELLGHPQVIGETPSKKKHMGKFWII